MITFKNIAGNKFLAVGTIQRKSALNGEKSLTGTLYDGKDVLNKIDKGWSLEFGGEPYVVTYFERNDNDNSVSFDAIHKFFWDMTKKVLYSSTEISGSHTIKWYLDQIFANTGYTYALNFNPAAIEKDNWGNKTRLSLFNDLITSIAGEFEINGTLISIFQNIGTDLSTIVRYGFNLSDMTIENDATSFVTYGEGFGAYADQQNQTGDRVHVTYTSPLAGVYGILQAEPIDDQRYTSQANLQAAVKAQVDASFSVSVQLSLYDLATAGYPYKMANVGDWLTAVDENLDFKQRIRIISIDDEFSADGTRISYTVTAGDVGLTKKYQDANASMASQVANAIVSAGQASTDANFALIAANGKLTAYYVDSYDELPTTANEGDLGWVTSGDGKLLYIYTKKADGSYYWEKRIDPEMGDQIAAGVTEAVAQANAHTDEVKQGLSTDIATAKSQAASQASAAEANAKSAATSQFNQAKDALAEAKANLQSDIDETKGNIVEINQTLTGFDGALQRVKDVVNGLGQTNQLMNTEFTPDFAGWYSGNNAASGQFVLGNPLSSNSAYSTSPEKYSGSNVLLLTQGAATLYMHTDLISVGSGVPLSFGMQVYSSSTYNGSVSLIVTATYYDSNKNYISQSSTGNSGKITTWTRRTLSATTPANTAYVSIAFGTNGQVGTTSYSQPMLVFESGLGAYVQGNYNNNDALAKVKLTADQASLDLSTYKKDADGRISKAQSDITATAQQVATKVSQTDYDTKTGQITTSVSKAQQTADAATTSLANYKTDADGRISANSANIVTNANAITQKVSQTTYDSNKQTTDTNISNLKQRADGFDLTVAKVNDLSVGGRNLLFNSAFLNSFSNWNNENNSWTIDSSTYQGNPVIKSPSTTGSGSRIIQRITNPPVSASKVTVSFNARGNDSNSIILVTLFNSNPVSIPLSSSFSRYTVSFTIPNDFGVPQIYFWNTVVGNNVFLNSIKVDAGNVATDWTPAPEDTSTALAQVKITADSISNFVRDSSGNISSDFQTALSKTSIITDSTLATSIQNQTATQITQSISDNNSKIIAMINLDTSGVQIDGKNILLNGDTTVTGDFYAKGGNFKNLNASNITVGTLNGTNVNITNINANNIVSGAISGANLNINLNTGSVVFQKGRINSSDYTTDINIDQGYISTANGTTRALLTQGKLQLIDPTMFSPQTNPYLEISNNSSLFNGMSALIKARDSLTVSINGYDDRGYDTPLSTEKFVGLSIGKYQDKLMPTKIGGAEQGVIISGGKQYNDIVGTGEPYIYVGSDSHGASPNGDRISLQAKAVHIPSAYNVTWSASANVYIASDGSLYRASSAKKYKQDIKHNVPLSDSKKLLEIPLSTWIDKRQYREKNDETRYFGMIAEDLRDAGLEYLVQYGEDNEVEGINYDRVALLLIPLVKELKERIEELESEGK